MKRNRFGINVDEGVALTTPEEFELLFVDTESDAEKSLLKWLKTGDRPVLFGGQIGCGKTTLLAYVFHKSRINPDMAFHFGRDSLNLSSTDSWSIVFSELFAYIASHDWIGMDDIPLEYKEILGNTPEQWIESISQIRLDVFSDASVKKNKAFQCLLESNQAYLPRFLASLIRAISSRKDRPMILFASGIDKFQPGNAAYFALTEILHSLSAHKTLFEMNAVHLFHGDPWMGKMEKIILRPMGHGQIQEMLVRRLGRYAKTYTEDVALITGYSGGIPRQALRLLDSFLAVQKRLPNKSEAFFSSVEQVNRDLFAFSPRPESALMKNVDKNRFLETGLISLFGDPETAQRAVFANWIILEAPMHESRWKAFVNPVIKEAFVEVSPQEPERALLKAYANQVGITDVGLDVDIHQDRWHHTLMDQLETPIELNVTEILDSISSALLSTQRADRVVIAFEDRDMIRAYLWQDIIRLGFSPSGTKEQKKWLFQYGRSLRSFWEVENYPGNPSQAGKYISATIDSSRAIGLTYEYAIENAEKFTVRMMYAPPVENRELMWMHDMDGKFFSFPAQRLLNDLKKRQFAVRAMDENDLGSVIDSLIIHPTPHQHVESPLDNHDIRVGGGLENLFLYLFHLRVQLCPDKDRRAAERHRLISLFASAIGGNSVIATGDLMKIPN